MLDRQKNFEDPLLTSQDMRTPKFKSVHFYCVNLYIKRFRAFTIIGAILASDRIKNPYDNIQTGVMLVTLKALPQPNSTSTSWE